MQDIKLTTMLFCVVIVFLCCNFLPVLTNILESFYDHHNDRLTKMSNFSVTLNSSVNFIIYVVLVRKFRMIFVRQFKSFFGVKEMKRKTLSHQHTQSLYVSELTRDDTV